MTCFVTATNTEIGKTYTTLYLIKKLSSLGYKVGAYKPIETGVPVRKGRICPEDATALLSCVQKYNPNFQDLEVEQIVSYTFALPASVYVAKQETKIDLQKIKNDIKYLQSKCDILLIEGAGGLMVPIERDFFMIDLMKEVSDKILLVSGSYLGCINDLLLNISKCENEGLEYKWALNLHRDKESFHAVTYPFLRDYFATVPILELNDESIIEYITH